MIKRILRKNKIKSLNSYVEPDEIFLDSENIQHFDTQQFEGRIETPVSKSSIWIISVFFLIFGILFLHFIFLNCTELKSSYVIFFFKKLL